MCTHVRIPLINSEYELNWSRHQLMDFLGMDLIKH